MISIADSWNCVATVFFIDTAHNVIDYIEAIYKILQPGGCWINLGIVAHTLNRNCTQPVLRLPMEVLGMETFPPQYSVCMQPMQLFGS